MKSTFYKNLYQSISFFSVIMILVVILLGGFVASLDYKSHNGWILLVLAATLLFSFFSLGFYWIFQKVSIDEKGIKIVFINKIIKECKWEEIESIEETGVMRNPALRIKLDNGSEIHLDKRKSIIRIIEKWYKKTL